MSVSRRRFLKLMTAAGVTVPAGNWLWHQLEAYAAQRAAFDDVRGPGLTSFSRTVCRDCPNHCSMAFRKVDEIPVGVRGTPWHPMSHGALCVAGMSQMQALFDPDRLRLPRKRERGERESTDIPWTEAIEILHARLQTAITGGSERIVVVDGRTPSLATHLLESWAASIPGASYVPFRTESALDHLARDVMGGGGERGRLVLDFERTGLLFSVGAEILEVDGSPVTQMRTHAMRRLRPELAASRTVYLGPRSGPTGTKADMWIPCMPGQEREILLALGDALSKLHPRRDAILERYARWVPEARNPVEFARQHSIESVSQRLGLEAGQLRTLSRAMHESRPAVTLPGPGILRRDNGSIDAYAALALNLWTEGFREEGGLSWQGDPLRRLSERLGLSAGGESTTGTLEVAFEPILEGGRSPLDVLICVDANLAHELPSREQVERGLRRVPFVVSFATHPDETAALSHLTLPIPMSSESWDLPAVAWGVPQGAVQVQRPAILPVTEARSVVDVVLDLSARGARGPRFQAPWADGKELVEAAVSTIVAGARGELVEADQRRRLTAVPGADAGRKLLSAEAVWVDDPFDATGPVRTNPGVAAVPPRPPGLSSGQIWLVGFDAPAIQRGRVLNRPMMMELSGLWRERAWETWIEIHPDDAERLGFKAHDVIQVRGAHSSVLASAVVTRSVTRGTVAVPVGMGHTAVGRVARGHGANVLSLHRLAWDDVSGVPSWGPVAVSLEKA